MPPNQSRKPLLIDIFKALSNPARLDIIDVLRKKPLTVSEIVKASGYEQSHVSHSLSYLEERCFVSSIQQGREVMYKLNNETILPIVIMANEHINIHGTGLIKAL